MALADAFFLAAEEEKRIVVCPDAQKRGWTPRQATAHRRDCGRSVRLPRGEGAAWRSPQKDAYLALFHTTSAVVPIDPAGLYHFSSSSEREVIIRLLSMPSKLGHELLSI